MLVNKSNQFLTFNFQKTTMSNILTIMDSLFDDVRPVLYRQANILALRALNVTEFDNRYEITITIAGIDPNQIKLELADKVLNISYEDTGETSSVEKHTVLRQEYKQSSFLRSVTLPKNVDQNSVKAKSKQGILTVVIDKTPETMPKQIIIDHE
jgi:HSP20 family protein